MVIKVKKERRRTSISFEITEQKAYVVIEIEIGILLKEDKRFEEKK